MTGSCIQKTYGKDSHESWESKSIQQSFRTQDEHTNVSVFLYTWRRIILEEIYRFSGIAIKIPTAFFLQKWKSWSSDSHGRVSGESQQPSSRTKLSTGGSCFPILKFYPMLSTSKHCGPSIRVNTWELNSGCRCHWPWPTDCWQGWRSLVSGKGQSL